MNLLKKNYKHSADTKVKKYIKFRNKLNDEIKELKPLITKTCL